MILELRKREGAAQRCPYCHDVLVRDEWIARCETCNTAHHTACAVELGRCASCAVRLPLREQSQRCCICGSSARVGDVLCDLHRRESLRRLRAEAAERQAALRARRARKIWTLGGFLTVPLAMGGVILVAHGQLVVGGLLICVPPLLVLGADQAVACMAQVRERRSLSPAEVVRQKDWGAS